MESVDQSLTSKTAKLFNDWALSGRGDQMAEGHWPRVENFFDAMAIQAGMTCLDVGCGNGYLVRKMAKLTKPQGKAIGIDIAKEMVELASSRSADFDNTEFYMAPADHLPLEDSTIDRIISVEMLYYAPSPEDALTDWYRITKSGGSVWVMVDYYKENQYSACWGDLLELPVHFYSEADYVALFKKVGFTHVSATRLMDPRPADPSNFKAGWGYNTIKDVEDFRQNVGSLLIQASKA